MIEALIAVHVIAVLVIAAIWLLGRNEPVFKIAAPDPVWFLALKLKDPAKQITLGAGVAVRWVADAQITLIGPPAPYWDHFIVAAGGDPVQSPLVADQYIDDAYIVRLKLRLPPAFILGLLRVLNITGLASMPKGNVAQTSDEIAARLEIMPSAENIATLLKQPQHFAPAMMNFLRYYPQARYAAPINGATSSTGAQAYARYGIVALRSVYQTGGRLAFMGQVKEVLREPHSGPTLGAWHELAVMQYSEPKAILTMEQIPAYVSALKHRDAGLEATIIIASRVNAA